ncbi:unnamed protein product [Caenorhabditis angaria]|uniref:Acetyl-CoA carboxylase n=1 Tax=Caenorhabditis angaria TaxID=860376 RepID=A0A9P1N2L1_9PELO|nr:unnamed protein product [Caenorhabditis angaria]
MSQDLKPLKILIATNGLAAVKFISSIKQWNTEYNIKFICLTTIDEVNSGAEYLRHADDIYFLPAGENKNNFANIDEIQKANEHFEPNAIFVGWGHASENPDLSAKLGCRMIGPSEKSMRASGDKLQSTIIAQSLGIPTTKWSFSHLKLKALSLDEVFEIDWEKDPGRVLSEQSIDRPLMIKATNGGGGKGIRKVTDSMDLKKCIKEVNLEVPGPYILMKCIEKARHIEFQILGDKYGNVVSLGSRDCTIQRRCQKVFEEAPATIVPNEILKSMENDAIKFATFLKYHCAGTVEYLFVPSTNQYFFLELNPRLQVEHPCSEMICNVNIPAAKLMITLGFRLSEIPDIQRFARNNGKTSGHVIAARITCEDPDRKFLPSTGILRHLSAPSSNTFWSYFSISSGSSVHQFSDSQFGHIFAKGETREKAACNLTSALKLLKISATFPTQVNYLQDLLKSDVFLENKHTTEYLDKRISNNVKTNDECVEQIVTIGAAAIGNLKIMENLAGNNNEKKKYWTAVELVLNDIRFNTFVVSNQNHEIVVFLGPKQATKVSLFKFGESSSIAHYNQISVEYQIEETDSKYELHIAGRLYSFDKTAYDPLTLKSQFTGKFLHYLTENYQFVRVGQPIAQIESMKMIVDVLNDTLDGFCEHVLHDGDLVHPGTVISRLKPIDDLHQVSPIHNFEKEFENWSSDFNIDEIVSIIKLTKKCFWDSDFIISQFIEHGLSNIEDLLDYFIQKENLPSDEICDLLVSILKRIELENRIRYCSKIGANLYSSKILLDFATSQVIDFYKEDYRSKFFEFLNGSKYSSLKVNLKISSNSQDEIEKIICYTIFIMRNNVFVNNRLILILRGNFCEWQNYSGILSDLDFRLVEVHLNRKIKTYELKENVYELVESLDKFESEKNRTPTARDFRRKLARKNNTTYIYDFPMLFGECAMKYWKKLSKISYDIQKALSENNWRYFIKYEELIIENKQLAKIEDLDVLKNRENNGLNNCSVVAWIIELLLPDRKVKFVVIGNDITFQAGSLAIPEHCLFEAASKFARENKIARLNISCNSGARIGLAMDILEKLKIDENDGFIYIDKCYENELRDQIKYEIDGEKLKIVAVIGKSGEYFGVENLMGSGSIGGETSKAYREIPTYCYVTGRSVGIGAYTARLARRIIQHEKSSLILTGFSALNTLLGKKVYSSNSRLGGVEVMENNGIAHKIVKSDSEGTFFESSENCQGLFDVNSFEEIRKNWAKSIVTGRAKLCGQPVGVIGSQWCNTTECSLGDEAENDNNKDRIVTKAGQVWYPNSAFKTSQAISDFNREKLPLIMVLSLRGFSGGRKDMCEMILTFGSHIIDELSQYRQPVILYIPCGGELRGGAWAVVDSNVNPNFIHIVADKSSRGGILEPDAIVSIKLRNRELLKILDRSGMEENDRNLKIAKKAAIDFANKHDSWHRMLKIGAVEHVVDMKNSRKTICKILRNEMVRLELAEQLVAAPNYPEIDIHKAMEWVNLKLAILKDSNLDEQFKMLELYWIEQFEKDLVEEIRDSKKRFAERLESVKSISII